MASKENLEAIVKSYVLYSMGAGLIPISGLDIAGVTLIQTGMMKKIAQEYEVDFSEHQLKAIAASVVANTMAKIGATSGWVFPALGQTISQLTMSVFSGAMTYAISQVYIKFLEEDGKLFEFDAEKYKSYFDEQFEKGKEFVKNLGKKQDSQDPIEKLKELAELKDNGAITEEEFAKMKEKLFASL